MPIFLHHILKELIPEFPLNPTTGRFHLNCRFISSSHFHFRLNQSDFKDIYEFLNRIQESESDFFLQFGIFYGKSLIFSNFEQMNRSPDKIVEMPFLEEKMSKTVNPSNLQNLQMLSRSLTLSRKIQQWQVGF